MPLVPHLPKSYFISTSVKWGQQQSLGFIVNVTESNTTPRHQKKPE